MGAVTSRRSLLAASGVLAVGAGAVVGSRVSDAEGVAGTVAGTVVGAPGLPAMLVSRELRLARPDRVPGAPIDPRDKALPYGDLETPDGRSAGRFDTSHLAGRTAMHLHRLELPDGVLVGLGEASGDGVFTVVGASGAFAGASGSYRIRRSGDDTLEFSFHDTKAV